jgi:hypothetical protein
MGRRIFSLAFFCACFCTGEVTVLAQEFKLLGREVQIHGFASQGFIYTNDNNWLTMNTSQGSAAFTDMGLNMSSQITDKFRAGAQVYDRNLGQLGQYHPSLDWAFADYRFRTWLGIRGGKVKTTLGLFNDTQDLDFLHTFALLPQGIYPADLRDTSIAHTGGDIYGDIALHRHLGTLSFTAYAGHRSDSIYSGYAYLLTDFFVYFRSLEGLQYGGDLRWKTPLPGLLVGASRLNGEITGKGKYINLFDPTAGLVPYQISSKAEWTNQYYGEYAVRKWRFDAEYRRYFRDEPYADSLDSIDLRAWYLAGAYRICKRLEAGSYYSRYTVRNVFSGTLALVEPNETDTSLPQNHIYDKVITARVDLNRFWNVKIEGHFMDGYGDATYPDGFYPQVNPEGFKPNTNALVLKTSFHF